MITQEKTDKQVTTEQSDLLEFKDVFEQFRQGACEPEKFKAARLNLGIYGQRQKGLYMVRTKIPGGSFTGDTLRRLADAAEIFAGGRAHVTTRQDIQLHFVKEDDLYNVLEFLREGGVTTLGAGGNSIRNINACDHGGVFHKEFMNVAPLARAVSDFFMGRQIARGLPRKFKITFCGAGEKCVAGLADDLAGVAVDPEQHGGVYGFKLYLGGGLGAIPRAGKPFEDFVPAVDIHKTIHAVLNVFNRRGQRINRNRARIKFLLEKIGMDEFCELYDKERETTQDLAPLNIDAESLQPVAGAKERGASAMIKISTGDISTGDLRRLAELLEQAQGSVLRSTKYANLRVDGLEENRSDEFISKARQAGFDAVKPGACSFITSCNGAHTCNEGITNSKALAKRLEKLVSATGAGLNLRVSVSGCPNACGHHHTADIGLQGSAKKVNDILVPHYQVYLGGTDKGVMKFGQPVIKIPAKRIIDAVSRVMAILQEEKREEETVSDVVERLGTEKFENELVPYTAMEVYDVDKDSYYDWDATRPFSLEEIGPGECAGSALDIIDAYFNQATHHMASARKADTPDEISRQVRFGALASAKALLVTYGIDPETEEDVFREFDNRVITRGFVGERYRAIFRENGYDDTDGIFALCESFIEECHAAYTRINAKSNVEDEGDEKVKLERLDLTGVACPYNYIKIKLALETSAPGSKIEALIDDGSPIVNVPRSLANDGDIVESIEPVGAQFLLTVIKG